MDLVVCAGADRRCENLPATDEITVVMPIQFQDSWRDIVLACRNRDRVVQEWSYVNGKYLFYLALVYPLMFPYGDKGYETGVRL
jgi:hypothetical protein